jgi:hypothetical protein
MHMAPLVLLRYLALNKLMEYEKEASKMKQRAKLQPFISINLINAYLFLQQIDVKEKSII